MRPGNYFTIIDCCQPLYQLYDLSELGNMYNYPPATGGHTESAKYCKALIERLMSDPLAKKWILLSKKSSQHYGSLG